jgi:oligopeptide transport system ATP-binding protein
MPSEILLEARNLRKSYPVAGGMLAGSGRQAMAVDGVSFAVERGETLGIVGESGCGKTTLARMLLRLIEPDSGEIYFRGENWLGASGPELRKLRRRMQMVFQDPVASLNPRMTISGIVTEPLAIHEPDTSTAARAASKFWKRWALIARAWVVIPTNFPAASASGSVSRAR